MNAASDESQVEPPDDAVDPRAVYLAEMSNMQAVLAGLRADNWCLISEKAARESSPEVWAPLKTAAIDAGVEYETTRYWCEQGVVVAEKLGGRWFVQMRSLHAHVAVLRGK
jgi:hypothetical protein